jgi:holliday junction DNA helicase RuvA
LSALPKVGKKTAEQMILTLKGKLTVDEGMSAQRVLGPKQEVMSALVNLGFRIADVEQAVSQMGEVSNVEDGIKKGLAALSSL